MGWNMISERWPEIEVSFFGQAGNEGLATVFVSEGQLTSSSDHARKAFVMTHGRDYLEIGNYDSFLIYGARSRNFWPGNNFYSSACLNAALDDLTRDTPAQHVLSCLRGASKAPIFVGHTPLVAARMVRDHTVLDEYCKGIEVLNQRHYRKFASELVGQPLATIVNGRNTAPEYSWGVTRLSSVFGADDTPARSSDNSHMDGVFGALWLEQFFTTKLFG